MSHRPSEPAGNLRLIKQDGLMLALYTASDLRTCARCASIRWIGTTRRCICRIEGRARAAFTIPLSKMPLQILSRRKENNAKDLGRDDDGWCFPCISLKSEVSPIADLRQADKNDKRFPEEGVHSLRRTWESIANDEGI